MYNSNRPSYTTSPTMRDKKPFWRNNKKISSGPVQKNSSDQMSMQEPINNNQIYFSNNFSNQNTTQNSNIPQYQGYYPQPTQFAPNGNTYRPNNNIGNPFYTGQRPQVNPAPQRQYYPPNTSNVNKTKKAKKQRNNNFFESIKNIFMAFIEWLRLPQNSSTICLFILIPVLFLLSFFTNIKFIKIVFFIADISAITWLIVKKYYGDGFKITLIVTYLTLIALVVINILTSHNLDQSKKNASRSSNVTMATEIPMPTPTQNINISIPGVEESSEENNTSETNVNFNNFMEKWQNSDIEGMLDFVAPSWKNQQKDPTQALFSLLLNRRPKDYTIESISGSDGDSARTVTMRAEINKFTSNEYSLIRFQILMLKEQGNWYVDPSTLGTNIRPTKTPDPNATPSPTVAPRTTVTPKPADDTILYFNPNGGTKYHSNPECPSVNRKYLPLEPFTFAQIHEPPYNKLTNCLECHAPH